LATPQRASCSLIPAWHSLYMAGGLPSYQHPGAWATDGTGLVPGELEFAASPACVAGLGLCVYIRASSSQGGV